MSGLLLISAISPALFILYLVYKQDTEKEPFSVLAKCFGWGVLIIIPILIVESIFVYSIEMFSTSGTIYNFLRAFLVAGFTEELFKLLALLYILKKTKYFDQFYDGIVYAVFVSVGFALVENVLYVFQNGLGVAIGRAIFSVPGHAFFGVIMGYFVSLVYMGNPAKKTRNLLLALIIPMSFHGLFNFFLFDLNAAFLNDNFGYGVLLLLSFISLNIGLWRLGLRKIKTHILEDEMIIAKRQNDFEQDSPNSNV